MAFSFAPSNNHTNNINNGNNNNISHQHHYASYADMASHSTGTSHISSSVGSNATQLNMFTMVAMDASNDEHAKFTQQSSRGKKSDFQMTKSRRANTIAAKRLTPEMDDDDGDRYSSNANNIDDQDDRFTVTSSDSNRSTNASSSDGRREEAANGSSSGSSTTFPPSYELACVVCGESANGYNFNAISCESCKAFFRRNAFRPLTFFRCANGSGEDECLVNLMTRKKCKRCRLSKCLRMGMRRDWIMTDRERLEKKAKVECNKKRKLNDVVNESSNDDSSTFPVDKLSPPPQQQQQPVESTLVNNDQYTNNSQQQARPIRRRRRRRFLYNALTADATSPADDANRDTNESKSPSAVSSSTALSYPQTLTTLSQSVAYHHQSATTTINHHEPTMVVNCNWRNYQQQTSAPSSMQLAVAQAAPLQFAAGYNQLNSNGLHNASHTAHSMPHQVINSNYAVPPIYSQSIRLPTINTINNAGNTNYCANISPGLAYLVVPARPNQQQQQQQHQHTSNDNGFHGGAYNQQATTTRVQTNTPDTATSSAKLNSGIAMDDEQRALVRTLAANYTRTCARVKMDGVFDTTDPVGVCLNLLELTMRFVVSFVKLVDESVSTPTLQKLITASPMRAALLVAAKCYNKSDQTLFEENTSASHPSSPKQRFELSKLASVIGKNSLAQFIVTMESLQSICNHDMFYMLIVMSMFEPDNEALFDEERRLVAKVHQRFSSAMCAYMSERSPIATSETRKKLSKGLDTLTELARSLTHKLVRYARGKPVSELTSEIFSLTTMQAATSSTVASSASCS